MNHQLLKTKIYSLAYGGAGVGKINGKVCFVEGALPYEEILFKIVKEKKNYIKGKAVKILTLSADRIEPVCKYYNDCGGCQYQHITYEKELYYKQNQVLELIKQISNLKNIKFDKIIGSDKFYNYRESITLHKSIVQKNKPYYYGYFSLDNKTILNIDSCSIANKEINNFLPITILKNPPRNLTIKTDYKNIARFSNNILHKFYEDKFLDRKFILSTNAFTQNNRYIALKMLDALENWINVIDEKTNLFDVYCGAGFFTVLIKNLFEKRIGLDSNKIAVKCAHRNLKNLKISNTKFYNKKAESHFIQIFEQQKNKNNILILDPPRQGVPRALLNKIINLKELNEIFYVSCDPGKLARDIKIILNCGLWKLDAVKIFDMFPRTKHIETIAKFIHFDSINQF